MSAKSDKMYFDNLIAAAEQSCKAAEYLVARLNDYKIEGMKEILDEMHEYEHAGDMLKHQMNNSLAKAFVTPVDREDLAAISQNIDDVTDCIEEVLQYFYMYRITAIMPEAIEFSKRILTCCQKMKEMLGEFVNFKKPAKLHSLIVELNNMEEECDELYIRATMLLNDRCDNALEIISWREIYNHFENCADACEHVGDCIDMVVMKNS